MKIVEYNFRTVGYDSVCMYSQPAYGLCDDKQMDRYHFYIV